MGNADPLAPLYQQIIAWSDNLDELIDLAPYAILLGLKLVSLAIGLGVLLYGIKLYVVRRRVERKRRREGRNGLQQIISQGRVEVTSDFIQQAVAILIIGVVSVLTPQPVRPSVTVFFLLSSGAFVWIGWKSYRIVQRMDRADRDAAAWIRMHAPQVPLLPQEEE